MASLDDPFYKWTKTKVLVMVIVKSCKISQWLDILLLSKQILVLIVSCCREGLSVVAFLKGGSGVLCCRRALALSCWRS